MTSLAHAWQDHPLWIRENFLGGAINAYWVVHLALVFALTVAGLPVLSALFPLLETVLGGVAMFPIFALAIAGVIFYTYVLFFLPIRVCGDTEPMGYLCALSSLALPWFFLQ